jgi:hypothetical protein
MHPHASGSDFSLVARVLDLLLRRFTGTMKHLVWHLVILAAGVIFDFVHLGRSAFIDHFWEAAVPIVWIFSAMVTIHSIQAARDLIKNVRGKTAGVSEIEGLVYKADKTKFKVPIENHESRRFLRTKVWGTTCVLIILSVLCSSSVWSFAKAPHLPKPIPSPPAETALFMECRFGPLPITIAPGETVHIVRLNKKQIQGQAWGFWDVPNLNISKPFLWPDKKLLDDARKVHSFNIPWVCKVSNHGSTLISAAILIDLWFGNATGGKGKIIYSALISPLDAGKEFSFYLVNDCNISVAAIWEERAVVQVLGENVRREVPLHRTYRSPIDQIMSFFPALVRFVHSYPVCE